MKIQIIDSVNFAQSFLPFGKMSIEDIFNFLKKEVTYTSDPKDVELLQSMETLFTWENVHGVYGAGDCDCFTIASIASLYAKGYRDLEVVLAGRSINYPVHVYSKVNGISFDLTNKEIGKIRPYTFLQALKIKL